MEIKVTTSITLSTGHSVTNAILETFKDKLNFSAGNFYAHLRAFRSQTDKDNGKDAVYPFNGDRIVNVTYDIPQADIDQVATDGHYGIVGENHPTRIKDALATALGVNTSDLTITKL